MRIPDAIAPYASLLKWGLIALLAGGLFIGGCQHGKSRQYAKDQKAIEAADGRANAAAMQASILAETLRGIDDETAQREAQAKADAQRAAAAAQRAEQAAKAARAELAAIEADIAKAKRNPDCRQALEARACAALH